MAKPAETLETIDLLYRAALEPTLWPEALHRFAFASGGFGTAMIPITPGQTAGLVVSPDLLESKPDYDREWYQHDTRVRRIFSRNLTDGVCCEAELFTEDEIAHDPMRQEFCRAYGMGSFAAQLVMPMPNFVVAFSVMRVLNRGEFERHELDTLRLLGKHASRALLVSTHLAAARAIERTLANALAHFDCGALVIDREMRVVIANAAAEQLMGDGLSMIQGQLRAASPEHQELLARLMLSVLCTDAGASELETVALPRPSGRQPLLVQAIPVAPDTLEWTVPTSAAALVIVVDPEQDRVETPFKELCLLGLTRSEARLAVLIGAGLSRPEAAEMLGISLATASDTAKQIYSKLNLSRRSELVRLVERLAVLASQRNDQS
jgi:DNA-binding CsgD family transcriptional regulator